MPAGVFAIILAFIIGYFALSQESFSLFGGGGGPIASGPQTSEIRNPEAAPGNNRGFADDGRSVSGQAPGAARLPGESPYKGSVQIQAVERFPNSPDREYLILGYTRSFIPGSLLNPGSLPAAIDVTGWRIETVRSSQTLPQAVNIPEVGLASEDVRLSPGGSVVVISGTPAYQQNFRENMCTSYLSQSYEFVPGLSSSGCRRASDDASSLLGRGFIGACVELVRSVPACRTPQGPFIAGVIGSDCIDYINQNLNYSGCVRNFRNHEDFLGNRWRVFLGRNAKLYDPLHDRIRLRDRQGLLVDEYEY